MHLQISANNRSQSRFIRQESNAKHKNNIWLDYESAGADKLFSVTVATSSNLEYCVLWGEEGVTSQISTFIASSAK